VRWAWTKEGLSGLGVKKAVFFELRWDAGVKKGPVRLFDFFSLALVCFMRNPVEHAVKHR
jgi:hypothetical protein